MIDPVWLLLFRADYTDKENIKGQLQVKIKLDSIKDVHAEKESSCKLKLTIF